MKEKKSLGSEIYSDAASFGRVYAIISAVVASLFSIMFIIGGIYIIYHKSHLKSVTGTVTSDSFCTQLDKNSASCSVHYTYTLNGENYFGTSTSSIDYKKGDKITVWYDPNHPGVHREIDIPSKTIGVVAIIMGILIAVVAWVGVYVTRKYKFAAAASGVSGGIEMIKRAI